MCCSLLLAPEHVIQRILIALDEMSHLVIDKKKRVVICGDFNARSLTWDPTLTNYRGELVEEWAASCELRLLNIGREPTCIRHQGMSVVDLSWSSVDVVDRLDWRVRILLR